MKVHDDSSNEDLALLKARGSSFEPIPLRRPNEGPIEKLDGVLLLGFPAGPSILEKGMAETTATPGVVRKVEETIYVSGGMIGGNSGGPVLDSEGRAVGVATRVVSGTESFGSCLKIEHVIDLYEGGSW
jgi:S1-C subfamily serine protease